MMDEDSWTCEGCKDRRWKMEVKDVGSFVYTHQQRQREILAFLGNAG